MIHNFKNVTLVIYCFILLQFFFGLFLSFAKVLSSLFFLIEEKLNL